MCGLRVDQFLKSSGCKSGTAEPDLYFVVLKDRLEGVTATHVDDIYMAGKEGFHSQVARSPMSEFVVRDLEVTKFDFCGWKIEQKEDGSIKVDIEHAMKEISDNIKLICVSPFG